MKFFITCDKMTTEDTEYQLHSKILRTYHPHGRLHLRRISQIYLRGSHERIRVFRRNCALWRRRSTYVNPRFHKIYEEKNRPRIHILQLRGPWKHLNSILGFIYPNWTLTEVDKGSSGQPVDRQSKDFCPRVKGGSHLRGDDHELSDWSDNEHRFTSRTILGQWFSVYPVCGRFCSNRSTYAALNLSCARSPFENICMVLLDPMSSWVGCIRSDDRHIREEARYIHTRFFRGLLGRNVQVLRRLDASTLGETLDHLRRSWI